MIDIEERARTSTANNNQGSNWIRRTTRVKLYKRDGWKCRHCGKRTTQGGPLKNRATLDHLDANHKNNAHDNLATVCNSCNSKRQGKSEKDFKEYLKKSAKVKKTIKRSLRKKMGNRPGIAASNGGSNGNFNDLHPRDNEGKFANKGESIAEQVVAACNEFFDISKG